MQLTNGSDLSEVAQAICLELDLSFQGKAGEGVFKQTFRTQARTGELLALKVFKSEAFTERSEREIQAMLTCNHTNIAQLRAIDRFVSSERPVLYTIEEFLVGGTLSDLVESEGMLTPSSAFELGSILIDAVSHIASHRFVHRDLKPDNIMFRKPGVPVIVDFGLVRDLSAESLTADWQVQGPGTPYFASPEQLNNEKNLIDWRSDQFALGVIIAHCVFGYHPYESSNYPSSIYAVANRDGPSPQFRDAADDSGLSVLVQMVQPWPTHRLRTTQGLVDAWEQQREDVSGSLPPDGASLRESTE